MTSNGNRTLETLDKRILFSFMGTGAADVIRVGNFGEQGFFGHGPIMHEKVFEVFLVEGKAR